MDDTLKTIEEKMKKGERAVQSRVLSFEMTENGWR